LESEFPENIIETCEEFLEEGSPLKLPQETDYELALKSLNVLQPKLETDHQKNVLISAMSNPTEEAEESKPESSEGEMRTTTLPKPSLPTQNRDRPLTKHRRTTSIILP